MAVTVLKIGGRILLTIVILPLYWIFSLLVMIFSVINGVVLKVGGFIGGLIIIVALLELIGLVPIPGAGADKRLVIMELVFGAMFTVIPAFFQGAVLWLHEQFGNLLELLSEA
jgi:hypothetical protein